jgi:hypothetical protein
MLLSVRDCHFRYVLQNSLASLTLGRSERYFGDDSGEIMGFARGRLNKECHEPRRDKNFLRNCSCATKLTFGGAGRVRFMSTPGAGVKMKESRRGNR